MSEFIKVEQINAAVDEIHKRTKQNPKVGLILGSGLGDLAESVKPADFIDYKDIPSWPVSTIQGHKGRLVIGDLEGTTVLIMQGRAHYYEGYPISQIGFPIRVMKKLGIEKLIVTNAAGAINPEYKPGEVMIITDHLSLMSMGGENPLRGPNLDEFGARFPDMSRCYDEKLIEKTLTVCNEKSIDVHEGVYVCLAGPSFETPADLRFLRLIGADAVGMSTVPEVIVAVHSGIQVLGFSGISNKANLDGSTVTTHEEVLQAGKAIAPKLETIIRGLLANM
ncbi:MAG: purine-nucleoside phosphorylase [Chloroflexi bacterium]|nr:purine-nucleoside phosphorylase [Chloroflexota bacterium]